MLMTGSSSTYTVDYKHIFNCSVKSELITANNVKRAVDERFSRFIVNILQTRCTQTQRCTYTYYTAHIILHTIPLHDAHSRTT